MNRIRLLLILSLVLGSCTPHSAKVACELEAESDYGNACRDLFNLKVIKDDYAIPSYPPDLSDLDLQEILLAKCVQYYYQLNECRDRKGVKAL